MDELVKIEYLTEEDFFKEDDENKFYIKTKKNEENFFVDYVYEYNIKTKKLTVYCFGKKKIQFIHDNDGKIIHTFKFCVAPIDNYSSFVNSTPPKEYQMNIQLPYCRSNIFYVKKNGYRPSYYSKKALEKTFIEYYIKNKNVQEKLIKAVPLYKIYKKYHEDFTTLLKKVEVLNNKEEQLEVLRKEKAPFLSQLNKALEPFEKVTFDHMMRKHKNNFSAEKVRSELMNDWHNASTCWVS